MEAPDTPHGQFIHNEVIPLTSKIQREVPSRRCKVRNANIGFLHDMSGQQYVSHPCSRCLLQDVLTKLQESILLLRPFEQEEWPPVKGATPMAIVTSGVKNLADDLDDNDTVDHTTVTDSESWNGEGDEERGTSTNDALDPIDDDQSIRPNNPVEDNPQTREPVHPSIACLVESLVLLMNHPARTNKSCELALQLICILIDRRYFSGLAGGQGDPSSIGTSDESSRGQESLLHRVLEGVAKVSESNNEAVYGPVIEALKTIMTSPKCGVHEGSMLLALKTTFHVYLVTKSETCKASAKFALLDMLRSVFTRMEAQEAVARSQAAHKPGVQTPDRGKEQQLSSEGSVASATFTSQYHTDSYVLFRALCKLSSKDLPADNTNESERTRIFNTQATTDPLALNSKILSLELILAAMDFCGDAFCEGERFIHLVQHYLCSSLLKNCMSEQTKIAYLSQKIFLVLVYKFKGHLKQEIEVFLSNVFLRVLNSPNSSFKQKALVLESLRSLGSDPALLTQIFLNYDCDFDSLNLYKEIIHMLTRLAGKATSAPLTQSSQRVAEQEQELSLAGIEVLVLTMKAMLGALGLQGVDDDHVEDVAGTKIRAMLNIDILRPLRPTMKTEEKKESASPATESFDDISLPDRIPTAVGEFEEIGSSEVAGQIVDAFEMKRNAEQNFEIGAVKFTLSLKSGLNFFIDNGFVERDARDVALFFLANKDKLDKTQMGEALGREPDSPFVKEKDIDAEKGGPGFWVRILHHYVDNLDFSGLMFDDAIRLFLSGFRLPGEAQKIDRIMEKFAEKFTSQNPEVFPSADTAFILAFSVIMLNTDLHNPSIKPERRMTIDSFLRNNRGIGENGTDLPQEFLEGIFERIKKTPFSLKEDDDAREREAKKQQPVFDSSAFFEGGTLFGTTAEQRKRETFKKEKDELMAVTESLMRRRPEKNVRSTPGSSAANLDAVAPSDVVRPMFDVSWGPILGILSQILECSDDDRSMSICLVGFVYAVRIASHSRMSLVRDTYVSSLAKFTFLGSIKEMKKKNIESVRTLLNIAIVDGEYLGESWEPVLQCISQLARLRLSASGLEADDSFLGNTKAKKTTQTGKPDFDIFRQPSKADAAREAEENNGKAILESVNEALIDKVFASTVKLSAQSLARFIEQLIAVSRSEVAGNSKSGITGIDSQRSGGSSHGPDGPSIYSLQRLVEVADYNMHVRPRLVWAQVWEVLADFFAQIACHENAMVSVFAIDSLKQLSFKFLEKPELNEFNFQRLFLNPFLVVIEDKGSRLEIREMVLQCVSNIVMTKSHNLRSGWKVVFSILHHAAGDASPKIESLGIGILQRLLDDHLHELCNLNEEGNEDESLTSIEKRNRNANVDDFVGLCRASLSFVGKEGATSSRPIGLSLRAFCHTAIYADLIASKRVLPPVSGSQWTDPHSPGYTYNGLDQKEALEMVVWRPLLDGLAEWVCSPVTDGAGGVGCLLQRGSILALRAILLRHGHLFSTSQWEAVLIQTLIPAIQAGAEGDVSSVLNMSSESPFVSSIDFLAEAPPLPPPADSNSLRLFEANMKSSSKRTMGSSELMLEASLADLRHGGDGDLKRAYMLTKKQDTAVDIPGELDEPFPNSWLATTAPSALGLLTDIATEIAVPRGTDGSEKIWPLVAKQYKVWCVGHGGKFYSDRGPWKPCEAVVRVACKEYQRFAFRLVEKFSSMKSSEARLWSTLAAESITDVVSENVQLEDTVHRDFVKQRKRRYAKDANTSSPSEMKEATGSESELEQPKEPDHPGSSNQQNVDPVSSDNIDQSAEDSQNFVAALKMCAIALHLIHQTLSNILVGFVPHLSKDSLSALIETLDNSHDVAERLVVDQDIAVAFQEALLDDWGASGNEVQEGVESSSRLQGSAMYFLTQEAGATQAKLTMLSTLCLVGSMSTDVEQWDRESFAEPHLHRVMQDVLTKFVASEKLDGHRIAPNVWRNATESGGKVAYYCTSFASVVVEILSILNSMQAEQFQRHIKEMFPYLCQLICVQSDEIRNLVKMVMEDQVGKALQIGLM